MTAASDDILLRKLDSEARSQLLYRWANRAVHEVGVSLLVLADSEEGASRLRALPTVTTAEDLQLAVDTLFAVVEQAAEGWQASIDAAHARIENWQQVMQSLGPDQVTMWSAYVVLLEDLSGLLDHLGDEGASLEAALLLRNATATLAELRAGGARTTASSVAEAMADEEQRRQRREILELLPS
ncbi:MAG: hypothetical protein ABIJ09_00465 [Pseudomonadota bacterium]